MNVYDLSRIFWDYAFENPEKIKPNHIAMYFFAIEHCNRLGWKDKFGFPTTMVMDAISIKSYNTYIKTLSELVEMGFIKMIEKSKNQYSANIIALSKITKANDNALDKALIKHSTKQSESIVQSTSESIDSIDKQIYNYTNLPINNVYEAEASQENKLTDKFSEDGFSDDKIPNAEKEKSSAKKEKFKPPSVDEVQIYCNERQNDIQAYKFVNFYQSKGWKVGNQPMKDWKAAIRTWEQKNKENGQSNSNNTNTGFSNHKGNSYGSPKVSGKVSASSILARQAREQFTRNSESGDSTIEVEVVG